MPTISSTTVYAGWEYHMNLILTSDFPSTGNEAVFDHLRAGRAHPRIAWIPPFTDLGRQRFARANDLFGSRGFGELEYCDIDEEADEAQLSRLEDYDILYLSGGDPLRFRTNMQRSGLSHHLPRFLAAGRMVIAASGGSMQLTRNVSLFRLRAATLDEVFADRTEYAGLALVGYELLPHVNRFPPAFLEAVRQYSERVDHDIIALADGAAVLHTSRDTYRCVGEAARFRKGVVAPFDQAA
jgi:peptidase E